MTTPQLVRDWFLIAFVAAMAGILIAQICIEIVKYFSKPPKPQP